MKATHHKLWSRRNLLQTLSLGAGSLAFAASHERELGFLSRQARAAAAGPPKRLLIFFTANGIHQGQSWADWLKPGPTPEAFELAPITQPMARHRANAVFFENMFMGFAQDHGDTHNGGALNVLTGGGFVVDKGHRSTGPSIDQHIGRKVGVVNTPLWPSVQLVGQSYDTYASCLPDGTRTPGIQSPFVAYQKLFEQIPDGSTVKPPDTTLLARVMARKSVLDMVAKDVGDFQRRLPVEDRARMDAQLQSVRTLEQRLSATAGGAQGGGKACARPNMPTMGDAKNTKNWPALRRMYSDLMVATLACDISRVAMINWRSHAENRIPTDFAPINSPQYEHLLSHDYLDLFVKLKAWYMEEVAYVADQLAAIPEGGGSMLDNTIILWCTEISTGHQHGRMPWMTIGGKNLGVNVGRSLKLPNISGNGFKERRETGYPHARLLISLLNAMGVPDQTFGLPKFGTGPMEGYLRG